MNFFALGIDAGLVDLDEEPCGPIDPDDVDLDDLVQQYVDAHERGQNDPLPIAVAATEMLIGQWERRVGGTEGRRDRNVKSREACYRDWIKSDVPEEEREHVDVQGVTEIWLDGYQIGFAANLARTILDEYVEHDIADGEDEEEDELVENAPRRRRGPKPTANPSRGEPLSVWSSQGVWDAQHAFDVSDVIEETDADEAVTAIVDNARSHNSVIDPAVVRREADRLMAAWWKLRDEDGGLQQWSEQNADELAEYGHMPSEAYRYWQTAFTSHAVAELAHALEEDSREAL